MRTVLSALCGAGACFLLAGCLPGRSGPSDAPEVVVYTAHDSLFSAPIFDDFQEKTGIVVRPKFDVESTKTVGLVNTIMAERQRPRCDVFWNNEILHSLRLKREGLLDVYIPQIAKSYPAAFKDADGMWYGFAARARILLCNTRDVPEQERPDSILDLTDPKWKGRAAIAKPLFGTTATHAACLFAVLGDRRAKEFFEGLKANQVQVLSGNKQAAEAVASGAAAFGLTDTDDALQMIAAGYPVEIIYPDQEPGGLGTLFIPNTLCIVKDAPHRSAARRLVDYLLSPEVESALAGGPAGQIPLNPQVQVETRVETPRTVRPMEVDFEAAADQWDPAARFLEQQFVAG